MPRDKKKAEVKVEGAPDWMVTYGDAMTLLLCFFVIIVSMSEIKQEEKFQRVLESLRKTFGGYEGSVSQGLVETMPTNKLMDLLKEIEPTPHDKAPSLSDEEGVEGKKFRVTKVRDDVEVVIGGSITFDRFSATLRPEARQLVSATAKIIRGHRTKILVRGHATREPLPQNSMFADQVDLSYERAKSVAKALVESGVSRDRVVLVAVGATEPLKGQVYSDERRAANRRVEIIVTSQTVEDYAGTNQSEEVEESFDG